MFVALAQVVVSRVTDAWHNLASYPAGEPPCSLLPSKSAAVWLML